jgi:CheY-like chemotaxis protein
MNTTQRPLEVLVVDDDPFAQDLVRESLGAWESMTVTCADDGVAALRLLRSAKAPPDALVCDIYMPNMDGLEFLEQLARMQFRGAVILISGVNIDTLDMARQIATTSGLEVTGAFVKPVAHAQWANALGLNPAI